MTRLPREALKFAYAAVNSLPIVHPLCLKLLVSHGCCGFCEVCQRFTNLPTTGTLSMLKTWKVYIRTNLSPNHRQHPLCIFYEIRTVKNTNMHCCWPALECKLARGFQCHHRGKLKLTRASRCWRRPLSCAIALRRVESMPSSVSSSGTTSIVRQPNVFLLRRMSP